MTTSAKKKIVHIQTSFPKLSATFILDQITGMIDRGFDIEVWATEDPKEHLVHPSVERYNLLERTRYLTLPPAQLSLRPDLWLKAFHQQNTVSHISEIHGFHVHFGVNFRQFLPLLIANDKFSLLSFHGYDATRYVNNHGPNVYHGTFHRADQITVPSQYIKDKLLQIGCPEDRLLIHHYGIDPNELPLTKRHDQDSETIELLTIGRLVEKKGIEFSIRAFAALENKSNLRYRIIGSGDLAESLSRLCQELGVSDQVVFVGDQTKEGVQQHLLETDIFVLTSVTAADGDQEGLPVSLIEAQGMGIPAISTIHSGIPELVKHESTGLLTEEKDFHTTSAQLQQLIDNRELRKQLGHNARSTVIRDFNIKQQNDTLAEIFDRAGTSTRGFWDTSGMPISPRAVECNTAAEQCAAENKLEEASALLNRSLHLAPHYSTAHSNLGVILWNQNRIEDALFHLRAACEHSPDNDTALLNYKDVLNSVNAIDGLELGLLATSKKPAQNTDNQDAIRILRGALERKGWASKQSLYEPVFENVEVLNPIENPVISVVVISWREDPDTLKCFQMLREDPFQNFELIFVNNGAGPDTFGALEPYINTCVTLNDNTGAYLARNIGASFARAPIVMFLEDDGIPFPNLIRSHVETFLKYEVIAVRGVYVPKEDNEINRLAKHYYLGEKHFPVFADIEGNASYDARCFFQVGGWDDEIRFGGGGIDLAIRLLAIEPDPVKQIYSPLPKIHHDYAPNRNHLDKKFAKQESSRERLRRKHPQYDFFCTFWDYFRDQEHLLRLRQNQASNQPASC